MHILYFLQAISPSAGGGEALFYNFAKKLIQKGHDIHIICYAMKDPGIAIQDLIKMGVKIHAIKPEVENKGTVLFTYGQQVAYIINAFREGREVLKRNMIDIMHANTYTPIIPAAILGKISQVPVISTVHHVTLGHWKVWSSQKGVPRSASVIGPIYERFILGIPVHTVHAVSHSTKDDLLRINPNANVSTMYNGIDLGNNLQSVPTLQYQKFVLYIGRLVSTKNLGVAILAFGALIKSIPEAKLVIIGNGPMRMEWEDLARKNGLVGNVVFAGHVSEDIKQELLRSCSALVLPSKLEGFGRVIIEAFAMYKPVLVSSIKTLSEVVDNGRDGFLISPDDVEMWSEKIRFLLSNTEVCRTMGTYGRRKVEEKFNLGVISDKIEELYMNIASHRESA